MFRKDFLGNLYMLHTSELLREIAELLGATRKKALSYGPK